MYEENKKKKMAIGGILLAFGVVLTAVFHYLNLSQETFTPMYFPVLLGGFLLPPSFAIILGLILALINSVVLGVPELLPMGIVIMLELGICGLMTSIFYRRMDLPILVSLVLSMVIGRLVGMVALFVIGNIMPIEVEPLMYLLENLKVGVPGIVIQLILIPVIIFVIEKYTTINFD